jgi:hypothetical protein
LVRIGGDELESRASADMGLSREKADAVSFQWKHYHVRSEGKVLEYSTRKRGTKEESKSGGGHKDEIMSSGSQIRNAVGK